MKSQMDKEDDTESAWIRWRFSDNYLTGILIILDKQRL